jgi:hypothetical protein
MGEHGLVIELAHGRFEVQAAADLDLRHAVIERRDQCQLLDPGGDIMLCGRNRAPSSVAGSMTLIREGRARGRPRSIPSHRARRARRDP